MAKQTEKPTDKFKKFGLLRLSDLLENLKKATDLRNFATKEKNNKFVLEFINPRMEDGKYVADEMQITIQNFKSDDTLGESEEHTAKLPYDWKFQKLINDTCKGIVADFEKIIDTKLE